MEQKEQHKIRTTAISVPDGDILKDYVRLNKSKGTFLKIQLEKGKSGHKIFNVSSKLHNLYLSMFVNFNIPFPNDAYAFVRALDELILELATKNFDQKLLQAKRHQSKRLLKLRTAEVMGQIHKFHLELLFFPNEGRADIKPELCILLSAFKLNIENNSTKRWLLLPLRALPWLREQMADMLVRHDDGTEMIAREAPAKIPNKYLL